MSSESFRCPYCDHYVPKTDDTTQRVLLSFRTQKLSKIGQVITKESFDSYAIQMEFCKCPHCDKMTINALGVGKDVEGLKVPIVPTSNAHKYPDYIPKAIREDYEEACAIVNSSPKASATLSRRCLQGMIRDFWNINKNNLSKAIQELEGKVTASQWAAIDALRRLGNIGAHMEADVNVIVDIDPNEAQKLIDLIELLIEKWYIARNDENELLKSIVEINDEKQTQRQP